MAKAFKPVERLEVAKYYLNVELRNVVSGDFALRGDLSEPQLWRILEALSFTFRANGVFHIISDRSFDWFTGQINAKDIVLLGVGSVTKLIYSDKINRDPLKLRDFLAEYFKEHPSDDPLELNELRPQKFDSQEPIIVDEKEDHFLIRDGSHRLMTRLLHGKTTVPAYIARPNGQPHHPIIGDTHFLQLRQIYQKTPDPQQQEALLSAVAVLMKYSCNSREAIGQYWVDDGPPNVAAAGKQLLA